MALAIVGALLMSLAAGVPALAAASPVVTFSFQPPSPDGNNDWWRNPPLLSVTSDQDGTVHYDWGSGDTTVAADAGSPVSLGYSPEGVSTLRAFCVSSLGETGTVPQVAISVDSDPPPFPDVPTPSLTGGRVHLAWDPVTDAGSGLARYTIYRNLVGPPFSAGDAVAFVTGPSFTDDAGSGSGVWYYAVSARDRAGNESLLSDAVRTSADATPPSAPGDLQAWLNGDGFARMSWLPSIDLDTGVAYYVVERSVSGLPMSAVATVPASADFWDGFDPEAADAASVSYQVTAFDRTGDASTPAGPAGRGTDNGAPSTPAGLSLLVLPTPDGSDAPVLGVDFRTSWGASTDIVSGIARYAVYYGPDPASPSSVRRVSDPFSVFVTGLESATWTFGVRAEDRAGNVSELSGPATGHGATVDRVSGSDRVGTAVAVSAATFTSAHTVVFASAAAYPDGLSGASLAGALHAPVILVGAGVVPKVITDELTRLGAVDGYVIGGTPAVSSATFSSIDGRLTGALTRLSGPDRYATAAAVATAVAGIEGPRRRVYVVSGENFPDALSCGSAAYAEAAPILFARKLSLPGVTARAVQSVGATGCIIVGSVKAVFGGLEAQLPGAFRIGGADRYATSAAFADWAIGRGILTAARPVVVTGVTFPDGLSCAPVAGERNGPVLLIHTVGLDPLAWLNPHRVQIRHMTVIGGTAVIPATDKRILWWRLTSPRTPSPF